MSSRYEDPARTSIDNSSNANAVLIEHDYQRHRSRNSGGFLLESTSATTSHSSSYRHPEPDVSPKVKGKRKAEAGDLSVPKRAAARQRHLQKPSLGSSPLATEVQNAQVTVHSELDRGVEVQEGDIIQPHGGRGLESSSGRNSTSTASDPSTNEASPQNRRSIIGNDTDTAQIVNLALNLSESRRRNISGGGALLHQDPIGGRRLASAASPSLGISTSTAGGSLRQHLQQQRQISRNVSPRSGRSASGRVGSPRISQQEKAGIRRSSALPDFRDGLDNNLVFHPSDATLARVEKARSAIELSYEYRRLLQHLPKIPSPSQNQPATSKSVSKNGGHLIQDLGRVYNPLQYIRNRRVRFNEKRPLDSEGQGWNQVENVRDWVTTVVNEREDGLSRVDRRFPLPPFDPSQRDLAITDGLQNPTITNTSSHQPKKIARPHLVWGFSPWDLLADAYWLDQDDNATHIEDRHGKKILISPDVYSGDQSKPTRKSAKSPARRSESIVRASGSPEKTRASFESFRSDSRERRRWRRDIRGRGSPASDDDELQARKSRWPRKLVRSRSPSSSSDHRGDRRRGGRDGLGNREDYDHAALEKHMMDMLAKEAEDSNQALQEIDGRVARSKDRNQNGPSNGTIPQITKRRPSGPQRLRTDMPTTAKHQISPRASLDEQRFQHHRMSSDDFDSTAPNSPTVPGFVPSISINLSPPASPPTSAASPKKSMPVKLGTFRRTRSRSVHRRAVSDHDLDGDSGISADVSRQTTNEAQFINEMRKERSTDTNNGLLSPTKSEGLNKGSRLLGSSSTQSLKELNAPESRLRGFFKGGRIAEIVGNEVTKVGDMLWRKDNSNNSQLNSPIGSDYASEKSGTDDEDVDPLARGPKESLSRVVNKDTNRGGGLPRTSTTNEKPKYHMNNLPTFRSPFTKEEESPTSPTVPPDHDHITLQQLALRERGRSSRFDRLAPPKIDMRGISPSPSRTPSPDREKTQDEESRQSSSSRSDRRVRSADRRLNGMLGIPGSMWTGTLAPTGLSSLASRQPRAQERPTLEDKRRWSISDRGVSEVRGTITKRDIARVRALLLSSGVKANEITRRAEEVAKERSRFFQVMKDNVKGELPQLPRSQEYIFVGRTLVSSIEATTQQLRDRAEEFSHNTIEDLHNQVKAIDDRVTYKLTPLVRSAADDADAFSTELTTTHTLSVKQLNDSVDVILRKRRRRLRWIRRSGWAMLEWALLGIMWMVWFVVVIIRLVRCTVGGFIRGVKWLFWL